MDNPLPFDFHTLWKTWFSDDRTFTYATTITVPQGLTEYKASAVRNTKYHAMDFLYGKSYIFEKSIYLKFRGISGGYLVCKYVFMQLLRTAIMEIVYTYINKC